MDNEHWTWAYHKICKILYELELKSIRAEKGKKAGKAGKGQEKAEKGRKGKSSLPLDFWQKSTSSVEISWILSQKGMLRVLLVFAARPPSSPFTSLFIFWWHPWGPRKINWAKFAIFELRISCPLCCAATKMHLRRTLNISQNTLIPSICISGII